MELSKRLGLKPHTAALIVNAPASYFDELEPLPAGVEIRTSPRGRYGFVHFFASQREEMDEFADLAATHTSAGAKIWLSYPLRDPALAAHFRSERFMGKLAELGLSITSHLPMDDRWVAFRLRHEKHSRPIKAVDPTPGNAPRKSGDSSED
jgi:hypothetical protein